MDSHGTSPFSPSKEVLQQSDYTFQVSYSLIFPALPIQRSGLNRTSAEIHLWHTGAKAYNCVSSCRILELLRESSSRLGMDKANVYFILDLKKLLPQKQITCALVDVIKYMIENLKGLSKN
ncbi:hypothetical protein QL285_016519 [Trifolium repens]|nr:hypothetical protein QL285_016519 [Trifolium repens]